MTHEFRVSDDDRNRYNDRLDELADTAELMGDDATADRLREKAHRHRVHQLERNDPAK